MIATIVALPLAVAKGLKAAPCGYQRTPYYAHTGAAPLLLYCVCAEASGGTESLWTLCWREMDSNFWYRGTKSADFCTIDDVGNRGFESCSLSAESANHPFRRVPFRHRMGACRAARKQSKPAPLRDRLRPRRA